MRMHISDQLGVLLQVTGITSGRAAALVPAALALVSLVAGWVILARSKSRPGYGRPGSIASLTISVISIMLSVMHLIRTSDSSIGTGSGRLGAIVAVLFGLAAFALSGLAFLRSRKKTS